MRTLAGVLAALVLFSAAVLASAADEPKFQYPKDGNGLLDYCGVIVNTLDSPPTQVDLLNEMKFNWCVGYVEATEERISNWQISAAIQVAAQQQRGQTPPTRMWADDDFANICIPDGVSIGQSARVIVKWLRDHPEKLHELKSFLIMEALKDAFPCSAPAKEVKPAAKPTGVKP